MTFKPITYETYGKTETWGVDYENNLVLTPGGFVLQVPELIEWLRSVRSQYDRLRDSWNEKPSTEARPQGLDHKTQIRRT